MQPRSPTPPAVVSVPPAVQSISYVLVVAFEPVIVDTAEHDASVVNE